MDSEQRTEWVRAALDKIFEERIALITEGPMPQAELRHAVDLARSDLILTVREMLLLGTKPSEIRSAVQAFDILDGWMTGNTAQSTSAVKAARISKADIKRVTDMIRTARGSNV